MKGIGFFQEKEHGRYFDYRNVNIHDDGYTPFNGYEYRVYVGHNQTRYAKVLKTVAYVVVDEAADGSPIVEKWQLKRNYYDT